MDAPLYPPAAEFVQPERVPQPLSVRETPLAVLRGVPAAWAIVLKEIPKADQMADSGALKPHLSNYSLETLLLFGALQPDVLARIDRQLRALGVAK